MIKKTPSLGLNLPRFGEEVWHEKLNENFSVIDTIMTLFLGVSNIMGVYKKSTQVQVGDRYTDPTEGKVYEALVAHVTHGSQSFSEARNSNPTYWNNLDGSALIATAAQAIAAAVNAAASENAINTTTAATTALINEFNRTYVGAYETDPTEADIGFPPNEGVIYFNTTDYVVKGFDGDNWVSSALVPNNNLSDVEDRLVALINLGGSSVGRYIFSATDAADIRNRLDLVVGTDVQAYSENLDLFSNTTPDDFASAQSQLLAETALQPEDVINDNNLNNFLSGVARRSVVKAAVEGLVQNTAINLEGDAVAEFVWEAGSRRQRFHLKDVLPTINSSDLRVRFSTDRGANWIDDYEYHIFGQIGNDLRNTRNYNSPFILTTVNQNFNDIGNGLGKRGVSGVFEIMFPANINRQNVVWEYYHYTANSDAIVHTRGTGRPVVAMPINAVQFFMDTGSLASGLITMESSQ